MGIRLDDLRDEKIRAFLAEHVREMFSITPEGSAHALDVDALRAPDVTFWSAWDGSELVGCGALREIDAATGEVKSMRTAPHRRRAGVAAAILRHIIAEAERRGYEHLHLETGSFAAFAPARALYASFGFEPRGPFQGYVADPNSVFLTKRLPSPGPKVDR